MGGTEWNLDFSGLDFHFKTVNSFILCAQYVKKIYTGFCA